MLNNNFQNGRGVRSRSKLAYGHDINHPVNSSDMSHKFVKSEKQRYGAHAFCVRFDYRTNWQSVQMRRILAPISVGTNIFSIKFVRPGIFFADISRDSFFMRISITLHVCPIALFVSEHDAFALRHYILYIYIYIFHFIILTLPASRPSAPHEQMSAALEKHGSLRL